MPVKPAIASGTEIRQKSRSRRVRRLKGARATALAARATAPAARASPAARWRLEGQRAGGSPGRRPSGEVTGVALPTGSLSRAGVPAGEQPAAGGQGDRGVQGQHAQPGPGRQGR